jgi:hypothetical protein
MTREKLRSDEETPIFPSSAHFFAPREPVTEGGSTRPLPVEPDRARLTAQGRSAYSRRAAKSGLGPMFFLASKVLWFAAAPVTLLTAGALVGAWLVPRSAGFPRTLALACAAALLFVIVAPVGALLIEPLEDRFPPPPQDIPAPYGIVVLGGAIDD